MCRFSIDLYGIHEMHDENFKVNHSHAAKCDGKIYELLCFATPYMIHTVHGLEQGAVGDVVLHSPDYQICHYSVPGTGISFVNDWAYLLSDEFPRCIEEMQIPLNQRIAVKDPLLLRSYLLSIQQELLERRPFYQQHVSTLIEQMLIQVARAAKERSVARSPFYHQLLGFRQQMLQNCQRAYTVETMAAALNLSGSRFAVLYKKQFGISPVNDLINARVNAARTMLRTTEKPLREIALECGFQNEYYFSKVFKMRTGTSPSSYRR